MLCQVKKGIPAKAFGHGRYPTNEIDKKAQEEQSIGWDTADLFIVGKNKKCGRATAQKSYNLIFLEHGAPRLLI